MILNMVGGGGGAGLNFSVKAYASESALPSVEKENTIAVITETAITSWIFSATEPETTEEGMVWITVGASSHTAFSATKKNPVMVYPISAKQYVSGAWVSKAAKSYQNGEWVDWIHYLFNYGQQPYTWLAKGWKHSAASHVAVMPTVTNNADGSVTLFLGVQNGLIGGGLELQEEIDFTNASKLVMEYNCLEATGSQTLYMVVLPKSSTYFCGSETVAYKNQSPVGDNLTFELDVSNVTGSYVVGVALYCNSTQGTGRQTITIKRIRLE